MKPAVPAGALTHPFALMALGLLVANDHWWKDQFPGVWTGKLSDVAGLVLFPLLLQAVWEGADHLLRRRCRPSETVMMVALVATGFCFSAIQIWPFAGDVYLAVTSLAHAPGWMFLGVEPVQGHLTPDATDLLTLPALALPYIVHEQRMVRLGVLKAQPQAA